MTFNLDVNLMYILKGIGYYWMNEKTNYNKISQTLYNN